MQTEQILSNMQLAAVSGVKRSYCPPDYTEICPECRENGHLMTLCQDHIDQLASYDLHVHDLRMTAMRAIEMFRRMDALDVPAVLIEAQAKLIEQHLLDYVCVTLISRQAVETEIALWRARVAARKAG